MSLLSLLRIRPAGVVSKNDIGLRRILLNTALKISLEATNEPKATPNPIEKMEIAEN